MGGRCSQELSWGSPSHASLGDDILKEDLRIKLATGQEFITYII